MADILNKRSELTVITPMMQQYLEIKEEYSDYILMYRLGDFYECFFEDALIASRELELTLTSRDSGGGKRGAMCGVPFHKSDVYIGRLVEKGYKVAVCEQVQNPKEAQGIVKREVIRVVTPGTLTDTTHLTEEENNYLCSICFGESTVGLAFADITTGEVSVTSIKGTDWQMQLHDELYSHQPSEAIINVSRKECAETASLLTDKCGTLIDDNMSRLYDYSKAADLTAYTFRDTERAKLTEVEMLLAVGALIGYVKETQKSDMTFAKEINAYERGQYLELDINTRRNLELCETMRQKEKRGSLLWVLDRTKTAMGARQLRSWVLRPLINPVTITKRQSAVAELLSNRRVRDEMREILSDILDIERLTAKAVYGTANAKDLRSIYTSTESLPRIKELALSLKSPTLSALSGEFDTLDDIRELLGNAIDDNPPLTIREGGMIREGFNADIDYYRSTKDNAEEIMRSIEERERDLTGIRTLKISSNNVFGYYIEVSKSFMDSVPERYIRKQTLANCERYITQELKEMEGAIFGAEEKLKQMEYDIFCELRSFVAKNSDRIRDAARIVAELDVYASLAEVAESGDYSCPEISVNDEIYIKDGRHPVVEKFVKSSYFVPNDTVLDTSSNKVMIITGPNMAGKSTYMRQVALITIMAQIGSFVPARDARVGIVDKIFTRVGASDDLASGQSTFMLEMSEVAYILKNATRKSLIIYDEVGRGTSTFDGMSIARAVVEYTASKKIGAKTLFATHYHELTDMEGVVPGIVNYNIVAKKRGDDVIFLRKIVRGGTDDSYGIEVAKLAGVPAEVIRRSKEILTELETGASKTGTRVDAVSAEPDLFTEILSSKNNEIIERLGEIDINTITPIEAMNLLFELKKML